MKQKKKRNTYITGLFFAVVFLTGILLGNVKDVSAASRKPYLIKVNKVKNCLTIYEQDEDGKYTKPVKAMVCSTGAKTPTGTFHTQVKYRWKILLEDVWGQYCTRIVKDILFHSVYYYDQDPTRLSWRQYNNLGIMCSHGCIRLSVKDAKWIYDNCALGTTVKVYNSSKPGPLGKPEAIKLKPWTKWDPSDETNPKNPFNKKKPKITGATNRVYEYGVKIDLLDGVKGINTTGFDRTDLIEIKGKVNNRKAGKYNITYVLKDELGRTAKKKVTIRVKPEPDALTINGITQRILPMNATLADVKALSLNGITAKCGDKPLPAKDIVVTYKKVKAENGYIVYLVTYKVTVGIKSKTEQVHYYIDKQAPVITGVTDKIISAEEYNQSMANGSFVANVALAGVSVGDNLTQLTPAHIGVEVTNNNNGTCTLTYSVSDEAGNRTVVYSTLNVLGDIKVEPINAGNQVISSEAQMTPEFAMQNVRVSANGADYTSYFASLGLIKPNIERVVLENNQVAFRVTYQLTYGGTTYSSATPVQYNVISQ